MFHERIDRGIHAVLGWDPDDPVTDHLDDVIVAGYGVAALALAYRHRHQLQHLVWMHRTLCAGFLLFAAMVTVDFMHGPKTLEDAMKVMAGTVILVGFLAAWFEVRGRV